MRLLSLALGLALAGGGTLVAVRPAAADPGSLPHAVGGFRAPDTRVDASAGAPGLRARGVPPESASLIGNLPPVGDQGQISSCVAWTIAHTIMGYYAKRDGNAGAPYAPLYLYMRSVAKGGAPIAGLYPDKALTEATVNGVDTSDDYVQGAYNYQQPPTAAQVANAAGYRLSGWSTLWVGDRQGDKAKAAIKAAIAGGAPVAIGMPVFRDFMYWRGSALYNTLTGASLGGHMITAYAYDAEGIWIRNQWGTSWGAAGDAHLSWAFVNTDVMAAYTVSGLTTPAKPAPPGPTVTALSVALGPVTGGTQVTIAGANLSAATAVRFGDTPATFTRTEAGGVAALVATAPARARGPVDVTVTSAGGVSARTARSRFTYVPPAPAVSKLSAASASSAGGETITVTGTDLAGTTAVRLGGTRAAAVRLTSATTLAVTVPAGLPAGGYDVTVTTPYGTSAVVPAGRLTLLAPPAPVVSGLSPSTGATKRVTSVELTGANLATAVKVTVDGVAIRFTRVSDTRLRLLLPPHAAGPATVQVTTLGGGGVATFTYTA